MLVIQSGIRERKRQKNEVNKIHSSALSPYNAKDGEQNSSGRSPGFWLQTLLISPSHPKQDSGFSSHVRGDETLTSYSSATVSDLHRLPYSAETSCHGHLMKTLGIITSLSILIGFLPCQPVEWLGYVTKTPFFD